MKRYAAYIGLFVLGFVVCAIAFRVFLVADGSGGCAILRSVNTTHPGPRVVGGDQVAQAAATASKYVVSIDTVGRPVMTTPGGFFGFQFGEPQEVVPQGRASGVIISPNGYIVTNNHVVSGAAHLTVTLHNGSHYGAKLIGRDPKTDVAVIKINAGGLPAAKFSKNELAVGTWVIAVGNALGLGPTVTVGIISATKRGPIRIENEVLEDVIQTDAAINRGNSGGALSDLNGDLVGLNTAIASTGPDGGSIGIGFAVPSKTVEQVANQLIKTGKVRRPWLGIAYIPLNVLRESAQGRGIPLVGGNGVVIQKVVPGSPAAKAGLHEGDVIRKIDGKAVSSDVEESHGQVTISGEIGKSKVGDKVTLEVFHAQNGRTGEVVVHVGEMPQDLDSPSPQPSPSMGSPFPFVPESP